VYVLVLSRDGLRVPFYVGETSNLTKRMGDYQCASFQASTDFKVGEALRYLIETQKCGIEVLFRASATGKKDERQLIRELQVLGVHLLNSLLGFNYWEANADDERKVIEKFCAMLVRHACLF
jgi:hypothetical protein